MLRKTISLICFAIISLATSVNAQDGVMAEKVAAEKVMADKVVAVVGNSAILYSDLVEMGTQIEAQRAEDGYTLDRDAKNEALERLMLQKLLYNQALIDSIDVPLGAIQMQVESQVMQMASQFGGVAQIEAQFQKPIFEIKADMKIQMEERMYAQNMQETIESKVIVTPWEVERFYKKMDKDRRPMIPEQYIYAQITKNPASTVEAKRRTKETLLELRERIVNGTKFEMLARMYSVDPASAVRGGEMDPSTAQKFVKPFADALEKLKPNQVSEVVETEFGFHIIQLIEKKGDLYSCRHILIRPKFTTVEIEETNALLDSIMGQIRLDSISFETAAKMHSDDELSKQNGGIVSNQDILKAYQIGDAGLTSTKISKEDLMAAEYRVIQKLEIGDISPAFQSQDLRGNIMSKSIKLVDIIPVHPADLDRDYILIEEIALIDKKATIFDKWLKGKIASMYVRIDSEMDTSLFENKEWVK